MVKLAVCGAGGRMGGSIIRLAAQDKGLSVTGALERAGAPCIGQGTPPVTADPAAAFAAADVIIDFTTPEATLEHLTAAARLGKAIVIGTTGLSPAQLERIRQVSADIPVVHSPNMSVGVNLLFRLAGDAARALPGYDCEIVELHHNQKKDAPSGTAARLAEIIAAAFGRSLDKVGVYGRKGLPGARTREEIGVHAVRGGDIVGDHTVYFVGPGERIELTHRAHTRDTLAAGALVAARWVASRPAGLYDMQDVLGLARQGGVR